VVSAEAWRHAVLSFIAAVESFYDGSPPKSRPTDPVDAACWHTFWSEWRERKNQATT
jgi:hypothetical protein